jgi:hypothetical protein
VLENITPQGCALLLALVVLFYIVLLAGFAFDWSLDELIAHLTK